MDNSDRGKLLEQACLSPSKEKVVHRKKWLETIDIDALEASSEVKGHESESELLEQADVSLQGVTNSSKNDQVLKPQA